MKKEKTDFVDDFFKEWSMQSGLVKKPSTSIEFLMRCLRLAAYLDARLNTLCKDHDMTWAQFQTLAALRRRHPESMTAGEIMQASILTSGSVTAMLNQLLEKKWVKRSVNEKDSRQVLINLTSLGREKIDPLLSERISELEKVADLVSQKDRYNCSETLKKILLELKY